jgi:hypothetical protein
VSYTVWLAVIVDEKGVQPQVGITNQNHAMGLQAPAADRDLAKARRAHDTFARVITFAESLRLIEADL